MIKIRIYSYYFNEIKYVLQVLLRENLNIYEYIFEESESNNIELKSDYGSITINNHFFKGSYEKLYNLESLPSSTINTVFEDLKITTLYGNSTLTVENNNYYIGADIIGSAFFMLTQWESTIKEGDHLGRYTYETSTLKKFDLYRTPIVNQYILFLQRLLEKIGVKSKIKEFKPEFTCDVDSITKYKSFRNLLGGLYHRKSFSVLSEYFRSRKDKATDPYFTFNYMLKIIQQKNIDATFYFMTDVEDDKFDTVDYNITEPIIQKLFAQLKMTKSKVGLHPSINSWKNKTTIDSQKSKLETAFGEEIKDIRQHYLRYDVLATIPAMDELGFTNDSTIQFTEGCGFAAGICTPYSLYDLKNRKITNVMETPLIYMKKKDYVEDVDAAFEKAKPILDEAKKYNGRFSILFHNADLETENEKALFEKVMNYL